MTNEQYVNLVIKRLLGAESFREQLLEYLRGQIGELTAQIYTLNGTFGASKVDFDISVANKFDLDEGVKGTDGSGHLLETGPTYEQGVQFENSNGVDYSVGLHYTERPAGVQINPRTGYPEYESWQEVVGERAEPDEVFDEGDHIKFYVNTLAGGVNEWVTGRKALVWKKALAVGATTELIAIEECTMADIGGVATGTAQIVTTGKLGQDTISTEASDYFVLMLGPTVRRYTDLSATAGYWFIGEVTGGGAGSPPSAKDISGQRLIEHSLSDVLAYSGGPAWYDGTTNPATTIEAQFDKIITDLIKDTGTGGPDASGAHKIGAAAQSGSPESLSLGSIGTQLGALLNWINTKGHIAVANSWTALQTFVGGGTGFGAFKIGGQAEPSSPAEGEVWRMSATPYTVRTFLGGDVRKVVERKVSRYAMVGLAKGIANGNWVKYFDPAGSYFYTFRITLDTNPHWVVFPINNIVPQGARLGKAEIEVYSYTDATQTNRMLVQIRKVEYASGTDSLVAEAYATNFTGDQFFGPTCTEDFDSAAYEYYVRVRCSLGNSGSSESIKRGLRLSLYDGDYTAIP